MVTTIPQPVWKRTTTCPSIPFMKVFMFTKMPQPGQAPWPGPIRLGRSVRFRRMFPLTSIFPSGVVSTRIRPEASASVIGSNAFAGRNAGSPGLAPK